MSKYFIYTIFIFSSLTGVHENPALFTAGEHYTMGCDAYEKENWKEASKQFDIITYHYPLSFEAKEAWFYLGVSRFYQKEYELSNAALTSYLRYDNNPLHIEDAIHLKYQIAQAFQNGAKRRVWGTKFLPAILDGSENAFDIYDEIITAFPGHNLAAEALSCKAILHWKCQEHREAVDCYQTLIRRFPRHEKAPESYIMIARLYLDQSRKEVQNHDILALAELNLRKFELEFPGEERLEEARGYVKNIKENFANGLASTGQFYERVKKPNASIIYYQNTIEQFPGTEAAIFSQNRLTLMGVGVEE